MKVSVALCTYNGAAFLKEQLDSIFNQSYCVNEIVICDDCSSDSTAKIINQYCLKYPEVISFHKNTQNLGYVKNFEKALSLTTGDFIFLCDQDDKWISNKVSVILQVFKENESIDGIFSDAWLMDDTGEALSNTLWESIIFKERTDLQESNELLYDHILKANNIMTGCFTALRRSALSYLLPIKSPFWEIHDEYIALKLAAKNKLYPLNECLGYYRMHSNQKVGVTAKEDWETLRVQKANSVNYFFSCTDTYDDMSRLWVYYKRLVFYSSIYQNNEELIKTAYSYFIQFRNRYLSKLSFFSKMMKLVSWWKNNIYDVSWKEVLGKNLQVEQSFR